MTGPSAPGSAAARPAAGALTPALGATGVALAAHLVAAGCLPDVRGLVLAVPATLAAVVLLGRLLPERPLLRLAGGQLAGHLVLSVAAACAGHAHAPGGAMVLAHVAALVLLRAVLDRCAERIVAAVAGVVRRWTPAPSRTALPVLRCPAPPVPAPLRPARRAVRMPARGPPARLLPAR